MRFLPLLLVAFAVAQLPPPDPDPEPGPRSVVKRMDPRLKPEKVEALRKHAADLKFLYDAQAKARAELKDRQFTERETLVRTHRAARHAFNEAQHQREERSEFLLGQRREMNELEARHIKELTELAAKQKEELNVFHATEKKSQAQR